MGSILNILWEKNILALPFSFWFVIMKFLSLLQLIEIIGLDDAYIESLIYFSCIPPYFCLTWFHFGIFRWEAVQMLKMNFFADSSSLRGQVLLWNSWMPSVLVGISAYSITDHRSFPSHSFSIKEFILIFCFWLNRPKAKASLYYYIWLDDIKVFILKK